jgi:hypothetical protein
VPVNAELRRKNEAGELVDFVLVDDVENPDTGLADPSIDYGARSRLDTVVARLESLLETLADVLTNTQLRATPINVADVNGLVPKQFDGMTMTYSDGNVATVAYKQGGTTVATLTFGYTGDDLTSVSRT